MNRKELFCQAFQGFIPAPEDSEEGIPYYRAYAGLKAAWGEEFCKTYDGAVHIAMCSAGYQVHAPIAYDVALKALEHQAEKPLPHMPTLESDYISMPAVPTEKEAYEFFKSEYRRKYPGQRVNSKHAKALWEEKRARAMEIVTEIYQRENERCLGHQAQIKARNDHKLATWQAKVDEINIFRSIVCDLAA